MKPHQFYHGALVGVMRLLPCLLEQVVICQSLLYQFVIQFSSSFHLQEVFFLSLSSETPFLSEMLASSILSISPLLFSQSSLLPAWFSTSLIIPSKEAISLQLCHQSTLSTISFRLIFPMIHRLLLYNSFLHYFLTNSLPVYKLNYEQ